ncbi:uncharacterized protein [Gossypium hirsutum]|uniref:Retrotransposon gag domain-containing protein n=1 Tax=Gossypium hirsutum TaxID=3635 RepID=A0ABM3BWB1_GOSHI|nr:uncharacterized protein LOC121230513 [Gossypium hirsutum]
MSTRGTCGRGTRGRDGGREDARAGSSTSSHMPNIEAREAPASPVTETGSHDRNAFQGKYVGVSYVDARRREFLNLTQGDKFVTEYEAKFLHLSCYARGMVATKYECCVHFGDGLKNDLRVLIAPQRERDFVVLVGNAEITEDMKRAEHQNHEANRESNKRPCTVCRKLHQGECWVWMERGFQQPLRGRGQAKGGNGMSRGQKAPGRGAAHTEVRQPALVYAAHCREDRDAPDVIMGTFFIHNVPYTALIDVGSMHSYITCIVSKTLVIMVENTMSEVTVLSPLGQSVTVNKLFKDVPLEVEGMIFLVDLMELPFGNST